MAPGMRIVLLGRLAIDRDGVPASGAGLAGRRSEIVFARLAAEHHRTVSRDELADELWPEMLPDTWNAGLRSVLSDVRRFIEGAGLDPAETLVTEGRGLRFRLPEGAVLDIDEARAALPRARDLLAGGEAAAAAEAAGRAADLSSLPFLSHHEGSWADGVRSELDELHIRALEVQARALARAGDPRAAVAAADRLVRADPFLEAAHRLRIEMLGEAGDRAGAIKAYERCKALLAAELGIDPSPETEAALQRALQGRPAVALDGAPSSALAGRFGAYSVLVVEDHDFQRRVALSLLRGLGVGTLTEAADGGAALTLLESSAAPDVIVCDIDMPGMDGVEFIRHVAERRLASAVAIASGLDRRVLETVRAASEGYGLQVLGAVGKPLTARALEELLAAYRPPTPGGGGDAGSVAAVLAAALDDGTLGVGFEPVVDLALGSVRGVRAVAETGGDVMAAVDAGGLGRRFAEYLLRRASDAVRELDLAVWLDLPPSLLTDVSLADALAAIRRERVVLVIDVAGLGRRDSAAVFDVLARLRVKGYGLCLDVPGARSPLLEQVPLTHARLPADLVTNAAAGHPVPLHKAFDAARALEVPVIGRCETGAEFDLLLELGCSFAYGPFLAAPVEAAQLAGRVRGWSAPPAAADGAR